MATKTPKTPKTTAPTVSTPVGQVTVPATPFSGLVQTPATPTATAPKVHAITVAGTTYTAANHVATLKGTKGIAANAAATTYTLGATGAKYSPAAGSYNFAQWQAVLAALAANGGNATLAQIAAAFTVAGLQAGHAGQFVPYRAKAGGLAIVAIVA